MMSPNITLKSTFTLVGLISFQYYCGMWFAGVGLSGSSQRLKVTEWNWLFYVCIDDNTSANNMCVCGGGGGGGGVKYFDGPVDQT